MKRYLGATALALTLTFGGATASLAQYGGGPPVPMYNYNGGVAGGYAAGPYSDVGFGGPRVPMYDYAGNVVGAYYYNENMNGPINGGVSPATRYPVPGGWWR